MVSPAPRFLFLQVPEFKFPRFQVTKLQVTVLRFGGSTFPLSSLQVSPAQGSPDHNLPLPNFSSFPASQFSSSKFQVPPFPSYYIPRFTCTPVLPVLKSTSFELASFQALVFPSTVSTFSTSRDSPSLMGYLCLFMRFLYVFIRDFY